MPKTRKTIKKKIHTRRKQMITGGKAGILHRVLPLNNDANILGAGSFGLVASNSQITVKLFYNLADCKALREEAHIQEAARKLLNGIVKVPRIHETLTYVTAFRNKQYLCGIVMDRVPLVNTFTSAVHILLGYGDQTDIDTEWPRDHGIPLSEENPTRGFHASPEMIEAIWSDEGRTDISINSVAYTMGKSMRALLNGGILPYDLEWIYGGDGEIYLIDFGMCAFGKWNRDPIEYLEHVGSWGLGGDYYIPHKGQCGYDSFMLGFTQ